MIRQAIENKTTLFDGFAAQYIVAGRKALGTDADRLQFRFSSAAVLGAPELTRVFFEQVPLRFFVTSEEEWKLFAGLPAVRVLTYEEAAPFAGEIGGLEDKMRYRGFAYIRRQKLFLIGRDHSAVSELARRVAEWKEPAGEGLVLSID